MSWETVFGELGVKLSFGSGRADDFGAGAWVCLGGAVSESNTGLLLLKFLIGAINRY